MMVLILGTPDSGKSKKAEDLIMQLSGDEEKIYIATMIPYGREGEERVAKHRKMRQGKGFKTIECPVAIDKLIDTNPDLQQKNVLLECMSNLVGNEMHSDENKNLTPDEIENRIISEVNTLSHNSKNLVVVSNFFPDNSEGYDEDTRLYVKLVNDINSKLKLMADEVYEISK